MILLLPRTCVPSLPLAALCLAGVVGTCMGADPAGPGDPGGLLPPLTAEGQQDLENLTRELTPAVGKPKVIILDAVVTIDGQPRPDLGTFFSDTLSAKLLKSKTFEIIDASAMGSSAPSGLELPQNALDPQGHPTPSSNGALALDIGKANGADFVCVPTILSMSGEIRMTIRKLRIPGGKVESIVQDAAKGDERQLSLLADRAAFKLAPVTEPEAPTTPRYDHVQVWMTPRPAPDPMKLAIASAPKALRSNSPLAAARNWAGGLEPTKIGQITVVDNDWSFCELACPPGTVQLHQKIFAWGGGPGDRLVNLSVSRIEGDRVIAEFDALQPLSKLLRTGLGVYNTRQK